jgi:hypothetical protein
MSLLGFAIAFFFLTVAYVVWRKLQEMKRAEFIRTYEWPARLLNQLEKKYPQFTRKETSLISKGLRQFFLAYLSCGKQDVSMPSEVVDDLWHEFILYTQAYNSFCQQAFGQFLHHTPAVMLSSERRESNAGLRRIWWYSCKEENIDPRNPTRLPLLFALDAKLNIPNGYRYVADCSGLRRTGDTRTQCGGDFGSSSVDGGTDGFGSSGDSGGDGGDGGGCGGGGGD